VWQIKEKKQKVSCIMPVKNDNYKKRNKTIQNSVYNQLLYVPVRAGKTLFS
jgi:hypothetical protein